MLATELFEERTIHVARLGIPLILILILILIPLPLRDRLMVQLPQPITTAH